jgi:RNA polymerase sigma-70 factor (ECF subfamily)
LTTRATTGSKAALYGGEPFPARLQQQYMGRLGSSQVMSKEGAMREGDRPVPRQLATEGNEAALLRGLREAAPDACGQFYDRFAPRIQRFAVARFPRDPDSSEDVVVQTLVDAVRDIRRFNPRKSSLSAWLYGIARRRIQAEVRQRTRLKSVPASAQIPLEGASEISAGEDMASALAARLDAQRQIAALAGTLSDFEMDVLTLRSIDELSLKEIGQVVGRSERAVHSLLHRARQKARERLAQHAD